MLNLANNNVTGAVPEIYKTLPVFAAAPARVYTSAGTQLLLHTLNLSNNALSGAR